MGPSLPRLNSEACHSCWTWRYDVSTLDLFALLKVNGISHRFQPPNTWHEVYTPTKSVTVGGHMYSYDALHLTDVALLFDVMHPMMVTNQSHPSYHLTLVCMMVAIPSRAHPLYGIQGNFLLSYISFSC